MKKERAYAWLIWSLSAFFLFYKYAIEVSPSVMTADLMRSFGIDATQLGNLAACYFYAYLLLQIPAGLLIDRFGPRRVTSLAIALCGCGALLFGLGETAFTAGIGRFLTGTGAAFAPINCLKLTANWFPSNRFAFMAGLMMSVGMLGAVGGQAPLAEFIDLLGWRASMEVIGIAGILFAFLFWIIIRDHAPHQASVSFAPKAKNFWNGFKEIIKSKQTWWLSIYSGLAFAPVSVFGGLWGVPFLMQSYHLSHRSAAHQVSLIFIGFAVGAPFAGWLSDRLGQRKKVMFWGTLFALILNGLILYLSEVPISVLSIILFLFGATISCFLLCFTMIRESNAPILAATAIGTMNAFDALFGAFSDPLTGKFLDLGWLGTMADGVRVYPLEVYRYALSTLPIYLAIALFFLFAIKETFRKKHYPSGLP
jgi:MFS family permease